ncbi:hypothetical protein MKW92_052993 [Papaver armeniacum]|nr:hypothetical protein MKW92_052993 [Papaver armeniacum]
MAAAITYHGARLNYDLNLERKHLGSDFHPGDNNKNKSSAVKSSLGFIVIYLTKKESNIIIPSSGSDLLLTELGYDGIVINFDPQTRDISLRDSIDNLSLPYNTRKHVYNLLYQLDAPKECLADAIEEITKFVVPTAAKAAEDRQGMNSFVVFARLEVNIDHIISTMGIGGGDNIDGGTMTDLVATLSMDDGKVKVNASASAIAELKREEYCGEVDGNSSSSTSSTTCVVCMEDFEVGTVVTYMPCSHYFHEDCLVPWLQESNCCPLCRFQIDSD